MSAPPLRATDPLIARKYAERVAKHSLCSVHGPGGGLPADVRAVWTRKKKGAVVYHVLLGAHRRTFLEDRDAKRCIVSRMCTNAEGESVLVKFPVQSGAVVSKSADPRGWALTPVGCTCPDWLHRGTDSNERRREGLRSAPRAYRLSIGDPANRVMGALRGCKHMIAVKARLSAPSE